MAIICRRRRTENVQAGTGARWYGGGSVKSLPYGKGSVGKGDVSLFLYARIQERLGKYVLKQIRTEFKLT